MFLIGGGRSRRARVTRLSRTRKRGQQQHQRNGEKLHSNSIGTYIRPARALDLQHNGRAGLELVQFLLEGLDARHGGAVHRIDDVSRLQLAPLSRSLADPAATTSP